MYPEDHIVLVCRGLPPSFYFFNCGNIRKHIHKIHNIKLAVLTTLKCTVQGHKVHSHWSDLPHHLRTYDDYFHRGNQASGITSPGARVPWRKERLALGHEAPKLICPTTEAPAFSSSAQPGTRQLRAQWKKEAALG